MVEVNQSDATQPSARAERGHDQYIAVARQFLQTVLGDYHPRDFAVEFWDGSLWEAETSMASFTVVLKHPGALRRMFLPPNELKMGEAYIFGDFTIRGDLHDVMRLAEFLLDQQEWGLWQKLRAAWSLLRLPRALPTTNARQAELGGEQHSITRDRQAIRYHYDVSNDFYSLFLDERLVYSCAYFAAEEESLDSAQARKLDYICRKLRLQPGDRLLDIGCGWGALVMHAAEHYGVQAHGITLSERQVALAQERIAAAGLSDRCHVEICDYRQIKGEGRYDKLVSVGMVEHVGSKMLPTYFEQAWKLLRPGGIFLNHGIATQEGKEPRMPSFTLKYVFPDGELLSINRMLFFAEAAGFEVRDLESLREHYSLTLKNWVQRLQANRERALELVDPVTYRIWELYMSGARYIFDVQTNNIYQALLLKADEHQSRLPLTRADWYADGP